MLERYPVEGAAPLTRQLSRTGDSVTSQARRLGLPSPGRCQRQALSHARGNTSVNTEFFKASTPTVAFLLGFTWVCGSVRTRPPRVLRLRCPESREDGLLEVRRLLRSQHRVQRRQGRVVCEVSSDWLVKTLLKQYGSPPGETTRTRHSQPYQRPTHRTSPADS
jgi:hypothetical protein